MTRARVLRAAGEILELALRLIFGVLGAIGFEYIWYDGGGTEIRFRGHRLVRSPWGEHWDFAPPPVCRGCGCTSERACVRVEQGLIVETCSWVASDLCSGCASGSPDWSTPDEQEPRHA